MYTTLVYPWSFSFFVVLKAKNLIICFWFQIAIIKPLKTALTITTVTCATSQPSLLIVTGFRISPVKTETISVKVLLKNNKNQKLTLTEIDLKIKEEGYITFLDLIYQTGYYFENQYEFFKSINPFHFQLYCCLYLFLFPFFLRVQIVLFYHQVCEQCCS